MGSFTDSNLTRRRNQSGFWFGGRSGRFNCSLQFTSESFNIYNKDIHVILWDVLGCDYIPAI